MKARLAPDLRFAVPGDIGTVSGGYRYDRMLIDALTRKGRVVKLLSWPGAYPFPSPSEAAEAARSLAACPDGSVVLVDGLAFGALPEVAVAEGRRLRLVALVHHPLALETGLSAEDRTRLAESERRALGAARGIVATSQTTADCLIRDYAVDPRIVTVALPGTDPVNEFSAGLSRLAPGPPRVLSVGNLIPRKGHDVLVAALAAVADLDWICTIVGSPDRAPDTAREIRAAIAGCGLEARIGLAGEAAEVAPFYRQADLFVLASRHEGYGMVFAEALRFGLPVVGTTAGAIPEVVPPSAGILVPPDDVAALAAALRSLIVDEGRRTRLAAGARLAGAGLPGWEETAAHVAAALAR
jgi:glycosyltransferase involved in cell wall biosynthesis